MPEHCDEFGQKHRLEVTEESPNVIRSEKPGHADDSKSQIRIASTRNATERLSSRPADSLVDLRIEWVRVYNWMILRDDDGETEIGLCGIATRSRNN